MKLNPFSNLGLRSNPQIDLMCHPEPSALNQLNELMSFFAYAEMHFKKIKPSAFLNQSALTIGSEYLKQSINWNGIFLQNPAETQA